MKILISGSAGFLASNFIRRILFTRNDISIIGMDRITYLNSLHSVYINKRNLLHISDITDRHIVDVIFSKEKPDLVIHAANAVPAGTENIVGACIKHKVEKLIYISSDSVYGNLQENSEAPGENTSPRPTQDSAMRHNISETLIKEYAEKYQVLNYNIIRYCNIFGQRQFVHNFVPSIIKSIIDKTPINIRGDGMAQREWMHVDDFIESLLLIIEKGLPGEIYNVSSGYELRNIELCQKICNIAHSGHNLITNIDADDSDMRNGCSADKIKQLGWSPKVKLNDGLRNVIESYITNQWLLK